MSFRLIQPTELENDMEKTLTVKLFLLTRTESAAGDEYSACVVAAISEKAAREIANGESGSEGYVWIDSSRVEAKELGVAGDEAAGIILWSKETN